MKQDFTRKMCVKNHNVADVQVIFRRLYADVRAKFRENNSKTQNIAGVQAIFETEHNI